jgi:sucrose-6F-phosphate phosphohydrolase
MTDRLLISTDLDRTLIPNGHQPESAGARERFSAFVSRPEVTLAYVTGRHQALIESAIREFDLPQPDYAIADVGASVYRITDRHWQRMAAWDEHIAGDWAGNSAQAIHGLLTDSGELPLQLQEEDKQQQHKLSYYVSLPVNDKALLAQIRQRLQTQTQTINASLIWSIDEAVPVGLLDVLPASASKLHALEFLIARLGFSLENTLFAGDSGNDLAVLTSPVRSVLVANASDEVRAEAIQLARQHNHSASLYLATGELLGTNGNYSAGILEGVAHFFPQTRHYLART